MQVYLCSFMPDYCFVMSLNENYLGKSVASDKIFCYCFNFESLKYVTLEIRVQLLVSVCCYGSASLFYITVYSVD